MDTPAELTAATAAVVRAAYCDERNRWHQTHERKTVHWGAALVPHYDGGKDGKGIVRASSWEKVVRVALANGADPVGLVRAQFRVRGEKPPAPDELYSDAALAAYRLSAGDTQAELTRLFAFQRQQCQAEVNKLAPCQVSRGWDAGDVLRVVLGNQLVSLSALFRFCVAAGAGLADVAEFYRPAAVMQYLAAPAAYDAVWGGFIPPPFVAAARELGVVSAAPAVDAPVQTGEAVPISGQPVPVRRRPVQD